MIELVDWWHNDWIVLVSMKYELAWWFGIALTFHGCGFKSWRTQVKLYFCHFGFLVGMWRVEGTLDEWAT